MNKLSQPQMGGRLEYIDIAKGIGILLVVVQHLTAKTSILNIYISSFHMPLFFMLSGMLYNPSRHPAFWEYAKRKMAVLLKPLLIFIIINLALTYLLRLNYYTIESIIDLHFPAAMWFVWILFLTELISFHIIRSGKALTALTILTAFSISAILRDSNVALPLNLCSITVAVAFYGIGYMFKEFCVSYFQRNDAASMYLSIVGLFIPLIYAVCNGTGMDLSGNYIPHPEILSISVGLLSSICLVKASKAINQRLIRNFLVFLGKNSMTTLCLHILFVHISLKYFMIDAHLLYKVIEFSFVIVMCAVSSYAISRWCSFILK